VDSRFLVKKELPMHQTLTDRIGAEQAAQFSKGKKWRVLDAIMKEKGFCEMTSGTWRYSVNVL